MSKNEKPIGYWLKEADKAISAKVNQNLRKFNLTRSHWQVFNTVVEKGETTKTEIIQLLHNFFDSAKLDQLIHDFVQRKWMATTNDSDEIVIRITEEGKTAYSEILATQQKTRMQLVEGITKEEHATTIRVLKQIVANSK